MKFADNEYQKKPDNRYYICVGDYQNSQFMLGKAMTIIEWKEWFIQEYLKHSFSFYDIVNNEEEKMRLCKIMQLSQNEVIPYICKYYGMEIVVLEGNETLENKYLDADAHKLLNEKEVRQMLLDLQYSDLLNEFKDYQDGYLSIDIWCELIKTALNGDINKVIEEIDNFGAWIKRIEVK